MNGRGTKECKNLDKDPSLSSSKEPKKEEDDLEMNDALMDQPT
jgi:hypothetical protein